MAVKSLQIFFRSRNVVVRSVSLHFPIDLHYDLPRYVIKGKTIQNK